MWKKIIKDKTLSTDIEEKLRSINHNLSNAPIQKSSLMDGLCGPLLFKSYYSIYLKDEKIAESGLRELEFLFNNISSVSGYGICSGISGALYTLFHLERCKIYDLGSDNLEVDFTEYTKLFSSYEDLDYFHGTSGLLVSILEKNNIEITKNCYRNWLDRINSIAEDCTTELKWKRNLLQSDGERRDVYCLGLAHGTPSYIILLLKVYLITNDLEVLNTLKRAVTFLLNSRFSPEDDFDFPNHIDGDQKTHSRIAWCYGDLGCALALYLYANALKDNEIKKYATSVFIKHAQKRDPVKYRVDDPSICHGSVGIALIFARMFNYTGLEIFRETSEFWYKVTIEKAQYESEWSGFRNYGGSDVGYINSYNLLDGISGIGLALISGISDVEPKWDSSFLLS